MVNTLLLSLDAPLQAWGERGNWSIRDSAPEPTKSGIVGLLGCALGAGDDQTLRHLSEQLRMAVRVDRAGVRLTDYHTIGGGYDTPMLLTAQGKPKKSSGRPHTEISQRDYLCDAVFLVALWSEDEPLIMRLASAVQNPVWTLFLGRKSCPPSVPIFAGVASWADAETAICKTPSKIKACRIQRNTQGKVRGVIETTRGQGAVLRRDHLVSRAYRRFAPRYIREIEVRIPEGTEQC